jgi:hypothetical protein
MIKKNGAEVPHVVQNKKGKYDYEMKILINAIFINIADIHTM